jgi:alkylated DNA repair dioxygenase AlkB
MILSTTAPPERLTYHPGFLSPDEQRALLDLLRGLEYTHDVFRGQRLKRGYAQFGSAYVSTGRRLDPAPPLPDFLLALAARGLAHCPAGARFDQCIVTHYPADAGIGWHTDAPRFGDCIMAVSLGHDARLQFRRNGTGEIGYEVLAGAGSLYVMLGPARREYQHQVVKVKAERYSVTFRSVQPDEV